MQSFIKMMSFNLIVSIKIQVKDWSVTPCSFYTLEDLKFFFAPFFFTLISPNSFGALVLQSKLCLVDL